MRDNTDPIRWIAIDEPLTPKESEQQANASELALKRARFLAALPLQPLNKGQDIATLEIGERLLAGKLT
jgi:hypothetical protein